MALTWSSTVLITDCGDGRAHYPEGTHPSPLPPGPCQIKALCGRTIVRAPLPALLGPACSDCADIRRETRRRGIATVTSRAGGSTLAVGANSNGNIAMNDAREGEQERPHGTETSTASELHAFAAVLATMPDLVERLTAVHTPTLDGRWCTACTTPGQGTPHVQWPCIIATLAAEAADRA